ncbi:MAG: hypothetical protein FJ027_21645 [Candidatus Rokubacteria bacterium]|nr:hypothetical protein [Candidatus Rokubacteria bacterium]
MRRLFVALVLLYLALDLGNPHVAGAHNFDLDASVEAVPAQRAPVAHTMPAVSAPLPRLAQPSPAPALLVARRPKPPVAPAVVHWQLRPLAPPPEEEA